MVATYLKFFYVFQFSNNSDSIFCDFTQKYKFSALKKVSLIFKWIGGPLMQLIPGMFC